jgi:hypothetical protein
MTDKGKTRKKPPATTKETSKESARRKELNQGERTSYVEKRSGARPKSSDPETRARGRKK